MSGAGVQKWMLRILSRPDDADRLEVAVAGEPVADGGAGRTSVRA